MYERAYNAAVLSAGAEHYEDKTRPIIELFRAKELVITADGTRDPLEVQKEIRRKLELPPPLARRTRQSWSPDGRLPHCRTAQDVLS
jgi:hypothetical protein